MKKLIVNCFFIIVLGILLTLQPVCAKNKTPKDKIYSNKLFSITMPYNVKKTYIIKKNKNDIYVYDKPSKKSGYGGLAFGIELYKDPACHAMRFGGKKIGELTDKKNVLYDVVLVYPTDVQYDYIKGKSNSYDVLYNLGQKVQIQGTKNSKYHKNQGMKGEDLYKEVLKKHIQAIKEKWSSEKLEKENMSYMYNVLAQTNKNVLNKVGYFYYDVNSDGIDELFIGEITKGQLKGVVYDIYTMADRKPIHVISGGNKDRYFVCDDTFLCNEFSSGALEKDWLIYVLVENSKELYPQVGFKYDGYENKNNPWFISYHFPQNKWENVSEKTFEERKGVFNKYERFEFIPLSKIKF